MSPASRVLAKAIFGACSSLLRQACPENNIAAIPADDDIAALNVKAAPEAGAKLTISAFPIGGELREISGERADERDDQS